MWARWLLRVLRVLRVVAAACALALGAGCQADDEDERPLHTRCDLPRTGDALTGEWTLTAHGQRSRCADRDFEGELSIETSMPIEVSSDPQSSEGSAIEPTPDAIADGFVQRIQRAEYVLALGAGAPDELSLAGGTVGSCVSFTFVEALPGDDALVYEFDGAITDADFAEGEFTGEGPAGCRVEGSFELLIR